MNQEEIQLADIDEELEELAESYDGDDLKSDIEQVLGRNNLDYREILNSTIEGIDHINISYKILIGDNEAYRLEVVQKDGRPGDNRRINLYEY